MVRVAKTSRPVNQHHPVTLQLVLYHADFIFHHVLHSELQVRHRHRLVSIGVADAIKILIVKSGELQHRFAHGLARNRSRVDAHSAHRGLALDNSHALARLRGLNGRALPAWSRTNHNHGLRQKSPRPTLILAPVSSTAILTISIDVAR